MDIIYNYIQPSQKKDHDKRSIPTVFWIIMSFAKSTSTDKQNYSPRCTKQQNQHKQDAPFCNPQVKLTTKRGIEEANELKFKICAYIKILIKQQRSSMMKNQQFNQKSTQEGEDERRGTYIRRTFSFMTIFLWAR